MAIVGQLAFAALIFGRKLLRSWKHLIVCAAGLITVGVLRMHPIWGIVTASIFGFCLCSENKQEAGCDIDAD